MGKMKKFRKPLFIVFLIVCMLSQSVLCMSAAEDDNGITCLSTDYEVDASKNVHTVECDGKAAMAIDENGMLTLPIEVEESQSYNITLDYYPVAEETTSIKFELLIDGKLPMEQAKNITLKRIWKDSETKEYDSQGNQIRLPSSQEPAWMRKTLTDASGFIQAPLEFYLEAGMHTMTFSVYQNTLVLRQVRITPCDELKSYQQMVDEHASNKYKNASNTKRIEAEAATAKSDRSIVLMNDRTSPVTKPYSGEEIVYNSIGGANWKTVGEWVEWEIDVPDTGLYTIVLRYKQEHKTNDVSFRSLYIDGEIPFQEARSLAFYYDGDWQTKTLGNDNEEYQFYLTKGKHKIRLEASLGDYNEVIERVSKALTELNGIYTDIVMVAGTNPDVDRDYQFDKTIPEVLDKIAVLSEELKNIEKQLETLTGEDGGENASVIRRLYVQMDEMLEDTDTIAKRLNNFSGNLSSLGTWVNTSQEQPLQLDYIMLSNVNDGLPKDKAGFWATIKYYISQFLTSFKTDYANIGNKETNADKEITVWISSGRDQADIIRQLVNESFASKYGIGVNVQLVDAAALTSATLADVGPDVYIGMAQNQPVDYALRHAVVDLSQFEDSADVIERFYPDSLTSFYLDGELYALPDTMSYPMLFYRKDILNELGIEVEDLQTWDGLLQKVLPELDMNNFDFGMMPTMNNYGNLLYQNGGSFYNETNTASAFNDAEAITAFETITTLYTDYSIPQSFDFANRFRSGQMPVAITEFTSYNQLSIFAPEIEGLWGMLPIPGLEDVNGNIDNTALCTVTGSVILANSDLVDESWTFLKWWTSSEIQSRYASELETVMGTGARYASANIEAMQSVEWSRDIRESLIKQQGHLVGMPNIAGGYYTSRNFDFAFRDVVYNGKNLRETIAEAATSITNEILDKRAEFYEEE